MKDLKIRFTKKAYVINISLNINLIEKDSEFYVDRIITNVKGVSKVVVTYSLSEHKPFGIGFKISDTILLSLYTDNKIKTVCRFRK